MIALLLQLFFVGIGWALASLCLVNLLNQEDGNRRHFRTMWLMMMVPLTISLSAFHFGGQMCGLTSLGAMAVATLVFTTLVR